MLDPRTDPGLCHLFLAGVQHCAVVLVDPQGCVLAWNAGAEHLYGRPAADMIGRPFPAVGPDEPGAAVEGHVRREGWHSRADGSRFWAEVDMTPIWDAEGDLRGFGAMIRDITASREFQKELMRRALHDSLTGLPNRALLLDRVRRAIGRLERHPEPAALFFVDLDRFKAINDSLGHRTGDRVLVAVADSLRSALRGHDTVARLSGDEFVVLCERLEEETAAAEIAARVVEALQAPVRVADEPIALHASIGVVVLAAPGEEAEDVLNRADAAMYRAKQRAGGERIHVAFAPAARPDSRHGCG